jgi:hypothetical protein
LARGSHGGAWNCLPGVGFILHASPDTSSIVTVFVRNGHRGPLVLPQTSDARRIKTSKEETPGRRRCGCRPRAPSGAGGGMTPRRPIRPPGSLPGGHSKKRGITKRSRRPVGLRILEHSLCLVHGTRTAPTFLAVLRGACEGGVAHWACAAADQLRMGPPAHEQDHEARDGSQRVGDEKTAPMRPSFRRMLANGHLLSTLPFTDISIARLASARQKLG